MLSLRHGLLPILALALLLSVGLPAHAQTTKPDPEAALDPESPMAPMADIGVDWPDMAQPLQTPDFVLPTATTPEAILGSDSALRYNVVIAGLDPAVKAQLIGRFDVLSTLRAGEGRPANAAQISRRARDDVALLNQLLENLGYYDAEVEPQIERQPGDALIVRLTADAGTLYRFTTVDLPGLDETGAKASAFRDVFGVASNAPVNADAIIDGKSALTARFKRDGHPFAQIAEPQIIVDEETQTATLSMPIVAGGERRIGKFIVIGDRAPFGASHVAKIARFKPGAPFNQDGLEDLKRALIATGLASDVGVSAVPGEDPTVADVAVSLEPAPLRTIAGEFGYGTGEGVRISGSWTNRNLIPPEGAVTLRGVLGTREQLLGAVLRQGNFGKRDQVLNARIEASRSDFSAFKATTFGIAAGIERQSNIIWQKKWTWAAGIELLATDERDLVGAQTTRRRTFFIGAVPLTLNYDGTNDLLDATRGFRLGARVSPELSLQGKAFGYVRTQIDGSIYVPATDRVTIAARTRVGTIVGSKSDTIAPSRRFYAGGGGSIRGYGFQQIGPRDILNDPDGGRSLTEFALEARVRFGVFGVVPFIDAGNINSSALPKLSGLRFGAGIGARYHSNFGPIRIDVGTPINPQKGDARVTVFVSLGQAF